MSTSLIDIYSAVHSYYSSFLSNTDLEALVTIDVDSFRDICCVTYGEKMPRYLIVKTHWCDMSVKIVPVHNTGIRVFDRSDDAFIFAIKVGIVE
jgi:hypothetical protein